MTRFLNKTSSSLDAGLFVEATENNGIVSILAANLKIRNDRVTELTITLPSTAATVIPDYWIIDADHADAYDGSASATLDLVAPPTVTLGAVTLMLQPRSIHLLQFDTTTTTVGPIPSTLLDAFDRGSVVRGVSLGQAQTLSIGKIATSWAVRGVNIGQADPPPEVLSSVLNEIALGNPTGTPTWTTVTSRLLKIETGYGRNFELDQFETGTTMLLFDNSDRTWDPLYTGSAYYPNLKPLRRMRGRTTYGGTTRALYTGYIERIVLNQEGPNVGTAEVHLVDGNEVLQNAVMETPIPTLTCDLSGETGGGTVKFEAVGPWRGSISVSCDDPHGSQDENFPPSVSFGDDGNLHFSKRRSSFHDPTEGTIYHSTLDASEVKWLVEADSRASAVFKVTVVKNGRVGNALTGSLTGQWPAEPAQTRIGRALDGIGWLAADRQLDTSAYTVQAITFQDRHGVSAKQVCDDAAGAELGQVFLAPDGKVTFKKFNARQVDTNSTTTQLVLVDKNPAVGEFGYLDLVPDYGRDRIYNDILVEVASNASGGPEGTGVPAGGGGHGIQGFGGGFGGGFIQGVVFGFGPPVQTAAKNAYASDATSQARFFRRTLQVSTSTASAALPQILANELLRRYKDEHLRFATVRVTPQGQPNLWPHVLGRKVNDRILVKWTPPGGSQQIALPCWIESVKHSAGPGPTWVTEWGLSPVI